MPLPHDQDGRPLALGPPLASGGEGVVYPLRDDPTRLAKVYHQPPGPDQAAKLRWMTAHADDALCQFAGWPKGLLFARPGGAVVGFLMPRFDGYRAVHMLYSPAHRRTSFPQADWSFLVHAARNVAAAFDTIHGHGHVIGDVNQSNVLVSGQALVSLIDCDSFQVWADGKLHPCEVGVSQYTPPELQGQSFRGVVRTVEHDRFGLAVLLFHLLFMGRHPFAGRFLGQGEMPLEQAIHEHRFVYAHDQSATQMAPPPFALPLETAGPELAGLFERAFGRGQERPAALEWGEALERFAQGLKACPRDPGHRVPGHLTDCPWCGLISQGGPNFFLGVGPLPTIFVLDRDMLAAVWQRIEAIAFQKRAARPPRPVVVVPRTGGGPVRGRIAAQIKRRYDRLGCLPLLVLFVVLYWLVFDNWCGAAVLTLMLAWLFSAVLNWLAGSAAGEADRLEQMRTAASQRLAALNGEWAQVVRRYNDEFPRLKKKLKALRDQAEEMQARYEAERRLLLGTAGDEKEAAAQEQYLRGKFISDHKVPGIGPGRQVLLASYGVETAFDVTEQALQPVKGIGPKLRKGLLAWRQGLLLEFRYQPQEGGPPPPANPALAALVMKYRQLEEAARSRLQRGAVDLEALTRQTEEDLEGIRARIEQAAQDLAQTEATDR